MDFETVFVSVGSQTGGRLGHKLNDYATGIILSVMFNWTFLHGAESSSWNLLKPVFDLRKLGQDGNCPEEKRIGVAMRRYHSWPGGINRKKT